MTKHSLRRSVGSREKNRFEGFPVEEEWNFSAVRKEELLVCIWWEYLREIEEYIASVKALRFAFSREEQPTPSEWKESGLDPNSATSAYRPPFCFWEESEWPSMPFCSLPPERRKAIVSRKSDDDAWAMSYDFSGIGFEISCEIRRLITLYGVDRALEIARTTEWIPKRIESEEPPISLDVVALKIDWEHSDEHLIQTFSKWLKENRPKDKIAKETRGSGGKNSQLRARLKDLGVHRLLKDMSWEEACHYTQEFNKEPLLSDHAHVWRRSANAAKRKIEALRRRLFGQPWLPVDHHLIKQEFFDS